MSYDDAFGSALWLAAGGAAGYAAGRLLVAPQLAKQTASIPTLASSSPPALTPQKPVSLPRALASGVSTSAYSTMTGPSGDLFPMDPYAGTPLGSFSPVTAPSGDMQPRDPYADATPSLVTPPLVMASAPSVASTTHSQMALPTSSGPITVPSQGDVLPSSAPNPRPSRATSSRVRRFDAVFERYRGSIPLEYVRALVDRESNGHSSVRAGSAIGLMQIVPVVLDDYNKRHGSGYTSEHLADPATNVAIGCELLRIIITSYRKNHPRIRTLQTDWTNPRFVELLTLGWNAGFSEAGGVGRVAKYLEGLGATDIDIDQVSAHAKLAGASKHLSNAAKVAWCKSVVALYLRERAPQSS
ncbi:MAG: transglycosylase SLT domain-containing protein [Kofleriaceae bacterium]